MFEDSFEKHEDTVEDGRVGLSLEQYQAREQEIQGYIDEYIENPANLLDAKADLYTATLGVFESQGVIRCNLETGLPDAHVIDVTLRDIQLEKFGFPFLTLMDTKGEYRLLDARDILSVLIGGSTDNYNHISLGAITCPEEVRSRAMRSLLRYQLVATDSPGLKDVAGVYMSLHGPDTEADTGGFDIESFLQEAGGYDSMHEKMETLKQQVELQADAFSQLAHLVEGTHRDHTAAQLCNLLDGDPHMNILNIHQKFELKRRMYQLEEIKNDVQWCMQEIDQFGQGRGLYNLFGLDEEYQPKGGISIYSESTYIVVETETAADFETFYFRKSAQGFEDELGFSGFKTLSSVRGFPVIVIPREFRTYNKETQKTKTVQVSEYSRKQIFEHEQQHAHNDLIRYREVPETFDSAKDEVIAYLRNEKSLEQIEEILVYGDMYTYSLEGDSLQGHRSAVRGMLEVLADYGEQSVNLNVLGMYPVRLWPYLSGVGVGAAESVVSLQTGTLTRDREQQVGKLLGLLGQEYQESSTKTFDELRDGLWYRLLRTRGSQVKFWEGFYQKNLEGEMLDFIRDSDFFDFRNEDPHFLVVASALLRSIQTRWAEGNSLHQEAIINAFGQREELERLRDVNFARQRVIYGDLEVLLVKIFAPLADTDNRELSQLFLDIVSNGVYSVEPEVDVTLTSLRDKVLYARSRMAELG